MKLAIREATACVSGPQSTKTRTGKALRVLRLATVDFDSVPMLPGSIEKIFSASTHPRY